MKHILILLCALLGLGSCQSGNSTEIDNRTVQTFDVPRFMGKWHEIARYDHRFEKGMTRVTATYTLLSNGRIEVLNAGYKDGKYKEIKGKAKQPDPNDPGKLKVSFFLWFYADYYVLDIDPDYRYVLIGSSSDKYLWIMSREETLPDEVLQELIENTLLCLKDSRFSEKLQSPEELLTLKIRVDRFAPSDRRVLASIQDLDISKE
jgi:lipocalin